MKKTILFAFAALSLGFAAGHFDEDARTATVTKTDGFYIFWECKPVDPYELVGYVKEGASVMGTASNRKAGFLKNAQKFYPDADGLIYDPDVLGFSKAQVIKFKE